MPTNILEIEGLTKAYKDVEAVRGVSFSIHEGEIVGLLGPNGAGKTTTISMVLGLLEPTSGSIKILGKEFPRYRQELLARVNFAAVYAQLPGNLTVWQNLYIFALLYGVPQPRKKAKELLRDFDLEKFEHSRSGFLSSGEQSRLNLAKALLNQPKLLLLDEPTASLDPSTAEIIRKQILRYGAETNAGILWTSHNMAEITEVCNRVMFISHGKILLEGDPKKLPQQYGKRDLEELFITVAREPLSLQ